MASNQYGATTTVECLTGSACAALTMWSIARVGGTLTAQATASFNWDMSEEGALDED
jgi:hypothetical protein